MDDEFVRVYYLYKDLIFRLAFSYTGTISDAEDITQNVFIKLYKNFTKFKDDDYIKNWCLRVAINECKNLNFSYWKRKIFTLNENLDRSTCFIESTNEVLENAIFELRKDERIIIYLHYYEGYKIQEIAKLMKRKPATIQSILNRSRKKLKIKIQGEYEYER